MKANMGTEQMIAAMLNAAYGEHGNVREKHVFRETLRTLVRLAKAEQLFEIKMSVKKLTSPVPQAGKSKYKVNQEHQSCFQFPLEFHRSN